YRTEFVAVLNNQPRGGFLMRRPTVDVPVANGNDWGNGFSFFFQRNWSSQPAMRVRAPADTINRCNSAGGKARHAARRPHDRSGARASILVPSRLCRGYA